MTPQIVELFTRADKLQRVYYACLRSHSTCKSNEPSRHCPECREYLDLSGQLHDLLGEKPWSTTALEAVDPEPPDYYLRDDQRADWDKAWKLRREILAATAMKATTP